jgi:hypothetical protein
MLAFMGLGFIGFLIHQERMMLVGLLCCCVLCLYLKSSANQQMRLPIGGNNPSLKITHINLGNAENDYDRVIDYVQNLHSDFISFQELTPDWNVALTKRLSPEFGYIKTMTRLDQYGMGFFSKIPFVSVDTLYFEQVPNLVGTIRMNGHNFCNIISCQVVPPVNQAAFANIANHLNFLSGYIKNLNGKVILLGDLHLPPWNSEIQQFKIAANLQDSRRDSNPRNLDGSLSLPRIPVDHILFGQKFECTSFAELGNSTVGRLGITGTYQIFDSHEENIH